MDRESWGVRQAVIIAGWSENTSLEVIFELRPKGSEGISNTITQVKGRACTKVLR